MQSFAVVKTKGPIWKGTEWIRQKDQMEWYRLDKEYKRKRQDMEQDMGKQDTARQDAKAQDKNQEKTDKRRSDNTKTRPETRLHR